jgi:ABC-type transport system involved in cytochrome bd biosynthesis fused ATPase/permease subunit
LYSLYVGSDQAVSFTVISVLSLIRSAFLSLPITLSIIPQYISSFGRVQHFLSNSDIEPVETLAGVQIKAENASFKWPGMPEAFLKDITLHVSHTKEYRWARIELRSLIRPRKET